MNTKKPCTHSLLEGLSVIHLFYIIRNLSIILLAVFHILFIMIKVFSPHSLWERLYIALRMQKLRGSQREGGAWEV